MSAPRHRRLLAAICLGGLALVGSTATAAPRPALTLLAVGDVASCDSQGDERVAELERVTRFDAAPVPLRS